MTRRHGMTLIEIIIVVVIVGILAAVSTSGFRSIGRKLKGIQVGKDIAAELNSARMMAVSKQRRVGVVIDISATRQFLVFVDSTNPSTGVYTTGSNDVILKNWQKLDTTGTLTSIVATNSTNGGNWVNVVFETDGSSRAQLQLRCSWGSGMSDIILVPVTGLTRVVRP